ncbi:HAD family hydrolase [Lacticigenium naphthae]|uniref:HAD family hydrolase n=1 Tax=Lacticigenium naphthae TaxID=515351 RepID=UPI00040935AD|nr:HAD family phosphatase [Lacticigenium naphthae]
MNQIKAVIFDMDGLMFDTETIYYQANQAAADEINMPFDYGTYEKYIGTADEVFFAGLYKQHESKELVDLFIEKSELAVKEMMQNRPVPLKKGLIPLLDYLKKNNIKRIVASSSQRELVEFLLKKNKISHFFDEITGGDEVVNSKPAPDIFLKSLEKLGTDPKETLILEDSLNGVRAANAAEMLVIMVPDLFQPNSEAKEKSLMICEDLDEVRKILEKN